ncbi:hypothetical protein B0O99DRAFT_677229 [Bisporella sp. PMI_857]|nr:hypothetical protein B0O99DRAFT_677229 [Bisporella sp. PMI_857]
MRKKPERGRSKAWARTFKEDVRDKGRAHHEQGAWKRSSKEGKWRASHGEEYNAQPVNNAIPSPNGAFLNTAANPNYSNISNSEIQRCGSRKTARFCGRLKKQLQAFDESAVDLQSIVGIYDENWTLEDEKRLREERAAATEILVLTSTNTEVALWKTLYQFTGKPPPDSLPADIKVCSSDDTSEGSGITNWTSDFHEPFGEITCRFADAGIIERLRHVLHLAVYLRLGPGSSIPDPSIEHFAENRNERLNMELGIIGDDLGRWQ